MWSPLLLLSLSLTCHALSVSPAETARRLTNNGMMAWYAGKQQTALEAFCAALEHDPTNGIANQHVGLCRQKEGNLLAAVDHLKTALSVTDEGNRDRVEMAFNLGDVYEEMGYVGDATAIFKGLVEQGAGLSQAKTNLANVLLDGCGQRDQALEMYREVCAGQGGSANAEWMFGVTAASIGMHSEALECFERAAALAPDDDDVNVHLMVECLRAGQVERAEKLRAALPPYALSSWEYVESTPVAFSPPIHYFTFDMLALGMSNAKLEDGLLLEFGVYHGKTIRMTAAHFPHRSVHGFDTFSGIPEQWHLEAAGSYSTHGDLPPAPDNVQYHVGLFSETLPGFLEKHEGPVAFMNIDCDLYSSTKDIFDGLHDRVVPGTVIVFDEYVMNSNWQLDEFKAFKESVDTYGWEFEYLGISLVSKQAAVRIV